MGCLIGYNETNVNRLLTNYSPESSEKMKLNLVYPVVRSFENLYWSKSHCVNWEAFPILMKVFESRSSLKIISQADIVMVMIFLTASGVMKIDPNYFVSWIRGDPFYLRRIMRQYWFSEGLVSNDKREIQLRQKNKIEERKLQYLKRTRNNGSLVKDVDIVGATLPKQ